MQYDYFFKDGQSSESSPDFILRNWYKPKESILQGFNFQKRVN